MASFPVEKRLESDPIRYKFWQQRHVRWRLHCTCVRNNSFLFISISLFILFYFLYHISLILTISYNILEKSASFLLSEKTTVKLTFNGLHHLRRNIYIPTTIYSYNVRWKLIHICPNYMFHLYSNHLSTITLNIKHKPKQCHN